MAELEAVNRVIDTYNIAAGSHDRTSASRAAPPQAALLRQGRAAVQTWPASPRSIYIGNAGMTDDDYRRLVVDWRSPVAEVYYNQDNGKHAYEANGRTIDCELKLRRQFDIERRPAQGPTSTPPSPSRTRCLLAVARAATAPRSLSAITATIQKEQNEVIRHEDVPALLVSGIAGSGEDLGACCNASPTSSTGSATRSGPERGLPHHAQPGVPAAISRTFCPRWANATLTSITWDESLMCGLGRLVAATSGAMSALDALRAH